MISGNPIRFRKLRIAWSVGWGVVTLLLCVLWVRSYMTTDTLGGTTSAPRVFLVRSSWGHLHILSFDDTTQSRDWKIESEPLTADTKRFEKNMNQTLTKFGFGQLIAGSDYEITLPYWLPFIGGVLLATIPCVRWSRQYSLRTLLIATTLVAVMLGLLVYAAS
jgi:hypothetical protein